MDEYIERWHLPKSGHKNSRLIVLLGQNSLAVIFILNALLTQELWLFIVLLLASFIASSINIACDGLAVDLLRGRLQSFANTTQVGGSYVGMFLGSSGFYGVLIIVDGVFL